MTAFVANTNNLDLIGLRNAATGTYVNDADVKVTVKDKAGSEVSGETWPLTMDYVTGSQGDYRGVISHEAALAAGQWYTAEITANADGVSVAFWQYSFKAERRIDL